MHVQPRARPVAQAPRATPSRRCAEELARRWAIALIALARCSGVGEVPLAELARERPALCAERSRALLRRRAGAMVGGVGGGRVRTTLRRAGWRALAGALDRGSAVAAVEALRGVLWEALLDELGGRPPIAGRATGSRSRRPAGTSARRRWPRPSRRLAARAVRGRSRRCAILDEERERGRRCARAPTHRSRRGAAAVLVDEQLRTSPIGRRRRRRTTGRGAGERRRSRSETNAARRGPPPGSARSGAGWSATSRTDRRSRCCSSSSSTSSACVCRALGASCPA